MICDRCEAGRIEGAEIEAAIIERRLRKEFGQADITFYPSLSARGNVLAFREFANSLWGEYPDRPVQLLSEKQALKVMLDGSRAEAALREQIGRDYNRLCNLNRSVSPVWAA